MVSARSLGVLSVLLPLAASAALVSCGGGTPGEKVRPKDPTFAGVMGEDKSGGACREPEGGAEPLVVDWKPEQRGDLEVLMKDSVAVVSYSCKGFKLLKDCKVDGKYGFLGMTKKEQLVRLTNADEVKANLPLAGAGIAANIGAEMQRGATLDVALVMIGKVKTTWGKVHADELQGECDGATHFVKGATVGAFVMETGSKGQARTAAQIFGAGASGSSASEKSVRNQDGELGDCAKAAPDAAKAPQQCQAIVRLELKPILPKAAAPAADAPPPSTKASPPAGLDKAEIASHEVACPKGLVLAEGKCTEPTSAPAFLCSGAVAKECEEQCGKGHAGSCGAAGALLASGSGGASRDEAKARELFTKGCDGGDVKSCTNLGLLLAQGRGGAKDPAGAAKRLESACADADAMACGLLGAQYESGAGVAKDDAKALGLLRKGCEGGHDASCATAGKMLLTGRGGAKDPAVATDFIKRACDGGQTKSCVELAGLAEVGTKEVPKNPVSAKLLYQRACFRLDPQGCLGLGRMELGTGGNADAAKRAFDTACLRNVALGCAAQKLLFGGTRPVVAGPETMEATRACAAGSIRDCAAAGTLNLASGNKPAGGPQIDRACTGGDPLACAVKAKNK